MNKSLRLAFLLVVLTLPTASAVRAEIRSEFVDYRIDGQPFQGFLSFDDTITGKRPGVLVVHEWWGHNAYARKRAEMLAKLGYTAFALDMYGAGKLAEHPDDAKKFMEATLADSNVAEARFNEALRLLRQHPSVDAARIAAIGYCFGGGIVLQMARSGADLAGVVSFHGSLVAKTSARPGQVKAEILVLNGADDPFVTAEQIAAFKREMQDAGAKFEFVNYPGVKHSFTNPEADDFAKRFNMPLAYDVEADKDSWTKMRAFLQRVFNAEQ